MCSMNANKIALLYKKKNDKQISFDADNFFLLLCWSCRPCKSAESDGSKLSKKNTLHVEREPEVI